MYKNVVVTLIIFALLTISVVMSFCIERAFIQSDMEKTLKSTLITFQNHVLNQHIDIYSAFNELPNNPNCYPERFEQLLYQHKHLKNIGVIQNDKVVCDVYLGSRKDSSVAHYKFFFSPDGLKYLFSVDGDYITIVDPRGYFIEYDTNYYVSFNVPSQLSGLFIIGRQSKETYLQYYQHEFTEQETELIFQLIESHANNLKHFKPTGVKYHNDLIYMIDAADKGSLVAIFTHKKHLTLNTISHLGILGIGLVFGLFVSLVMVRFYLKSRTLGRLLAKAISNRNLYMVYQPLIDLSDNDERIVGFEALIRWQMPNGDFIRPDVFIPVAEKENLTHRLTQLIIEMVFEDMSDYLLKHPDAYVGINITPSDLHDASLLIQIQDNVNRLNLKPQNIVLELTERILVNEQAVKHIELIREMGFKISIDDFGTGASNVKYIADLKPDILKIDRSFVEWSNSSGPVGCLLEKLIHLGCSFNLTIVCEGIETRQQANRCQKHGADVGQGFYWYKPLPIKEVMQLNKN